MLIVVQTGEWSGCKRKGKSCQRKTGGEKADAVFKRLKAHGVVGHDRSDLAHPHHGDALRATVSVNVGSEESNERPG